MSNSPKAARGTDQKSLRRMADVFRALSNPHRLEILARLSAGCLCGTKCRSNGGACRCVGDLAGELGIAPSTMSHHLKELLRAGLIAMERRGQRVDCRVNPDAIDELAVFFSSRLK